MRVPLFQLAAYCFGSSQESTNPCPALIGWVSIAPSGDPVLLIEQTIGMRANSHAEAILLQSSAKATGELLSY